MVLSPLNECDTHPWTLDPNHGYESSVLSEALLVLDFHLEHLNPSYRGSTWDSGIALAAAARSIARTSPTSQGMDLARQAFNLGRLPAEVLLHICETAALLPRGSASEHIY